ncbi:AMP-dependent synthetase/ligase [Bradymonas sediminis]|uniref:Long-chain fatty acid--CoA ligase n=1 Tax=Bradymonas sediminis TaxID=1548548 RepID=A0A2Z4FPT2_9DELT|nr:long-chain fatty acid--CoA ligase [Bradymonas sediminis]AWV90634.1 long-chain fatty acid--CoA ligase [Bradymonas sediminis]TDP62363.1 long-chain acyl-CoA synthetase [Bradymonas sediminis]
MSGFETLVDLFEQTIEKHPNNPLFGVKKGGSYKWTSYQEFGQKVDACRGALAVRGVEKGDTVAIIADNSVEWAVSAYATYGLGAAFCPMYTVQMPKDWKFILDDSDAKVVMVANEKIYEQVKELAIETVTSIIFFEGDTQHPDYFQNVLVDGAANPTPSTHPKPDDIATFIYTSGTTGNPKGVRLSHKNLTSNVQGVAEVFPIDQSEVSLSFLPWAHSFGQTVELHMLMSRGASMGLAENVSTIIANLAEVRPTILMSVPRIFNRIYDGVQKKMEQEGGIKKVLFDMAINNAVSAREQREKSGKVGFMTKVKGDVLDNLVFSKVRARFGGRLKFAVSGGAALSPEVARFIDNLNIQVYEGYGLTETSPIVSANIPGHVKIGSVGLPLPGVKVTIRDVDGYPSGTGEVCVNGPNVMLGYHKLPEATAEVLDDDHTFHTGDLGRIDDDGFLWILGRIKEQYKLENGKYVVPSPIEEQLKLSPFINQMMLDGANKPYNVALIVVDEESLSDWLKDNNIPREGALTNEKVRALYADEIKRFGNSMKSYELPKSFVLIDQEFTPENDMLTPSLKVKRRIVLQSYGKMLEELYN